MSSSNSKSGNDVKTSNIKISNRIKIGLSYFRNEVWLHCWQNNQRNVSFTKDEFLMLLDKKSLILKAVSRIERKSSRNKGELKRRKTKKVKKIDDSSSTKKRRTGNHQSSGLSSASQPVPSEAINESVGPGSPYLSSAESAEDEESQDDNAESSSMEN